MTNVMFVLVLVGAALAVFTGGRMFDVGMGVSCTALIGMSLLHAFNSNQKIK